MVVGSIVNESAELPANLCKRPNRRRVAFGIAEDENALEELRRKREQPRHARVQRGFVRGRVRGKRQEASWA